MGSVVPIVLRPSIFSRAGTDGDFGWMIEQPRWQNALFIFNDNESQSQAFLAQVASGHIDPSSYACQAGGGNAVIRPYQCQTRRRAAGVPTGPGYASLIDHAKSQIDDAIASVGTLLASKTSSRYHVSPRRPRRCRSRLAYARPNVRHHRQIVS